MRLLAAGRNTEAGGIGSVAGEGYVFLDQSLRQYMDPVTFAQPHLRANAQTV